METKKIEKGDVWLCDDGYILVNNVDKSIVFAHGLCSNKGETFIDIENVKRIHVNRLIKFIDKVC